MAIRKPNLSATEARRLATIRSAAGQLAGSIGADHVALPPIATPVQPSAQLLSQSLAQSLAQSPVQSPALPEEPETPAPLTPDMPAMAPANAQLDVEGPAAGAEPPAAASVATTAPTPRPTLATPAAPPRRPASGLRPATATNIPASSRLLVRPRPSKVQVFLSAPLPAPGVSKVFEMLCHQYPPQKALQMILRKALEEYESKLDDGSFQKMNASYATAEEGLASSDIQTSRMFPTMLLAVARAHFDPLGLESTRAFGRKLATAALAMFFAREARRSG